MPRPLTAKQLAFIEEYMKCHNNAQAYRAAYNVPPNATNDYVACRGLEVYKNENVHAEIEKREQAVREAIAANTVRDIAEKWSREDSLDAFKEIYHTSVQAMRKEQYDDSGEVIGYSYNPSAANQARSAVDSINKMLGYNEPDKSRVDASVTVELGEFAEFAK